MKKVSIVLPVYNGAERVRNAIDSIITQDYSNFELIIVNDCSTDSTLEIVSSYAKEDSRIKIITNPTNLKLPKSLNVGFANATGEYYTWTSDDNTFNTNAISTMVNTIESKPNIDFVYADYSVLDSNGTTLRVVKNSEPNNICFGCNIGACFLYTRELAKAVGEYNADMFLAEDYEYWIRCYKKGDFMHIPLNLYNYGLHENSLTATKRKAIYKQTYIVMMDNYDFLHSLCKTQSERNRFYRVILHFVDNFIMRQFVRVRFWVIDPKFVISDVKMMLHNLSR